MRNRTKIFFLNMRNFILDPKNNQAIHARNAVIAGQDIQILDDLNPTRTPLSPTKEVLMPADKAIVAYRDWLEKFDDMGWRIDMDEFAKRQTRCRTGLMRFRVRADARRVTGCSKRFRVIKNRAERKKIEEAA